LRGRTLGDAAYESNKVNGTTSEYLMVLLFAIKGRCILVILHAPQLSVARDLVQFVGSYMVASTLFSYVGLAVFEDSIQLRPSFLTWVFLTLVGFGLLTCNKPCPERKHSQVRS